MKVLVSEKLSEHKYKTPEGYLICTDAILARTGKQTYTKDEVFGDGDNSEIDIDRPYDQVMNEKTIASFENKPITFDHPEEDVNVGNYKDYAIGYVRDVHQGKVNGQDVILGNLVITDQNAINAIENGEHTDLSCGYDCDIKDDGNGHYAQNNIRGNHVALCKEGRAGMARIVDSKINDISWSWDSLETFIFKNYKDGPVHSEVDEDVLDGFDSRLDATKLADFLEKKAHINKTDVVRTRWGYGVKVYGINDSKIRDVARDTFVIRNTGSDCRVYWAGELMHIFPTKVEALKWIHSRYPTYKIFEAKDSIVDSKITDSKKETTLEDAIKMLNIVDTYKKVKDADTNAWIIRNTGLAYEVWNQGKLMKKFPTKRQAIEWIQDRFPGDKIIEDSIKDSSDLSSKVIDSIRDADFSKRTELGYEIVEMYRDGGRLHVIVNRARDYAIGLGYDTNDGEWEQGMYGFKNLAEAREALQKKKPYARRIMDTVKMLNKDSSDLSSKVIDSIRDADFSKRTELGYEIVEMYRDGGRLHVIVNRARDYAIGLGYDTNDGEWEQGMYGFKNLAEAREALQKKKPYARRIMDTVKMQHQM